MHGGTAVRRRKNLIEQFQRDGGPPFFVLSLKAGGTGLNLTAASHVIHGPAMLQVIDGELRLETDLTAHTAHAGDMVSLPRDIARKLIAMKPSTFLLTLSPEK